LLINYAALMILFGFLQIYLRVGHFRGAVREEYRTLLRSCLVLVGSVLAYLILHKALVDLTGATEVSRAGLLPIGNVGARLHDIGALGGFLWDRSLLVTYGTAAKALLWG
ncbi:hypothetical protein, partial [Stenotrophomonas sp. SrG]|uniref:hypothetical protein n=1 Tax=Stenotrophomonas sp. SrG TaxID=3414430 RepID=UPI003CF60242